jgi:formylglycine-generating enzyme required for sulfatase activity
MNHTVKTENATTAAPSVEPSTVGKEAPTGAFAYLGFPAAAWAAIPAGEFLMGSPEREEGRRPDERQHRVQVAPFQMLKTPVTFAMFDAFCAATGREQPKDQDWGRADRPAIWISYWDAVDYAAWLSMQTGWTCRLPTEAEWEYACRAGRATPLPFWTGATIRPDQANYNGHYPYGSGPKGVYREKTTPVDQFPPSPWGLKDMHGNVWEWCASKYDATYVGLERQDATRGRLSQDARALRGGSWSDLPAWLRSAFRNWSAPTNRFGNAGFRLARPL